MIDKNIKSISQLAVKTLIPRTTINDWFLMIKTPSIYYVVELAEFFGVTTDYLLGLEN